MFRRSAIKWPDNARVAVIICIVMESWPEDLGTEASLQSELRKAFPNARFKRDIGSIMDRQYGERVGVYRILEVLRQERIKASFFVNGHTVATFPNLMKQILAEGYELSSENWRHEYLNTLTPEEQYRGIKRTVDTFQEVLGFKPQGFIVPGERATDETPKYLVDLAYKYWMGTSHEDLPYILKVDSGELVVSPYILWTTDHRAGQANAGRTMRDMLQMWKDNFDFMYKEGGRYPGLMCLGVHPFLIGRPFRALMLQQFLRYVKKHPRVWVTRGTDLATYWREHYYDNLVEKWPNYGTGLAHEVTQVK